MDVESSTKVAIIGAGLGGVTLAALLAKRGYQVDVFEKSPLVGGRCRSFVLDKYRFDLGASMLLMLDTLNELGDLLCLKEGELLESLNLVQCVPSSAVYIKNLKTPMVLSSDLEKMKSCFKSNDSQIFESYLEYLRHGAESYRLAKRLVLRKSYRSILEMFTFENLRHVWFLKFTGLYNYTLKLFRNAELAKAFSLQTMFMGISPFDAIASYSMLAYSELSGGIWYPKGGMGNIPKLFMRIAEEHSANFHFNVAVEKINFSLSEKPYINVKGNELEYDFIVSNADLVYTYEKLLEDTEAARVLNRMEYGCSTISFYWGIRKPLHQCFAHQIFLGETYKEAFEEIFKDRDIPSSLSFYVHIPSQVDRTCCPDGHSSVIVLIPVGNSQVTFQQVTECKKLVLQRLVEADVNISEQDIIAEHVETPNTWAEGLNLPKGACLGLSHSIFQMAGLRPGNQDYKRDRLFFVGASSQPGAGVPTVLHSAMNTLECIEKQILHFRNGTSSKPLFLHWLNAHKLIQSMPSVSKCLLYGIFSFGTLLCSHELIKKSDFSFMKCFIETGITKK